MTGHAANGNTGAVRISSAGGQFNMSGGVITGNKGNNAGAVNMDAGVMTMTGGTITGNRAATSAGGGIWINTSATLNVSGGKIFGNSANGTGQNICSYGTVNISGGKVGARGDADAIYLINSAASLNITGAPVVAGGGVKLNSNVDAAKATIGSLTAGADIVSGVDLNVAAGDTTVVEEQGADGQRHYVRMKTLRVLSIGNSYSRDSFFYLSYLSNLVGMPIEAAYLEKGSGTLREHANLMAFNPEPSRTEGDIGVVYSYWRANMDRDSDAFGGLEYKGKVNAPYALADGDWDVVMLHQGTTSVGFPGTYNSDLEYLADCIRACKPGVKLYWNMTWAYAENDPVYGLHKPSDSGTDLMAGSRYLAFQTYYNSDQATMYNAIVDCLDRYIVGEDARYKDLFDGWFPVGAALQNLRSTSYGDRINRDGYHLALGGGRLTAALTVLKVLRPDVDLDSITLENIKPFLRITNDGVLFSYGNTDENGKPIGQTEFAQIIQAVKDATADLSRAPAKLDTAKEQTTIEAATNGEHATVAQVTAPLKLHFPDVARLADGTVVVGAYENVAHTPLISRTVGNSHYYELYNGFGSEGAGRLVVWTGDETGSDWNYDKPLLVIDQQQLEAWGLVKLFDRYDRLAKNQTTAEEYINYADPRDPNLTVTCFDMDGDGDKDEVLLLTFWLCNFKGYIGTDGDGNPKGAIHYSPTYMTWSTDGGETWQTPVQVSEPGKTTLKRGDIAVFNDGQILVPTYASDKIQVNLLGWNGETWQWVRKTSLEDFAPEETQAYQAIGNKTEFNELSLVAPNPGGDVVYGFIRNNGTVIKSCDRGETWTLVGNENGSGYETASAGYIHQPGFALIDNNRVYATWARTDYPRNTIGKVFDLNNGWEATPATTIYDGTAYGNNSTRDTGDPSAELLRDGRTVLVVSYDTDYRSIVGSKVTIDEPVAALSGTVSGGRYTLAGDVVLSQPVTVTGYLTVDLNGHKLSDESITVASGGTLAVEDSSDGQTGELTAAVANNGVFAVSGGKVTGAVSGSGTGVVTGGIFAQEPTQWLATDTAYTVTRVDGGYRVKPGLAHLGEYIDFGSALDMGVYLQGSNGINGSGYTVTASMGGAVLDMDNESGKILLSATGIPAKNMRDEITYTVMKGDEVYYTGTMSVYEAAKGWYDGSADAAHRTMVADMLNFGDEARKALKDPHHTYEALEGSQSVSERWQADASAGVTAGFEEKVAVTLSLMDNIRLNVYIDGLVTAVTNETAGYTVQQLTGQSGRVVTRISFGDINIADAKDVVSFTVTLEGGESFDVTTGIEEYVAAAAGGGQQAVIEALQKYVDSVIRYLGK